MIDEFAMKIKGAQAAEAMEMIKRMFKLIEEQDDLRERTENIERMLQEQKIMLERLLCLKSVKTAAKE